MAVSSWGNPKARPGYWARARWVMPYIPYIHMAIRTNILPNIRVSLQVSPSSMKSSRNWVARSSSPPSANHHPLTKESKQSNLAHPRNHPHLPHSPRRYCPRSHPQNSPRRARSPKHPGAMLRHRNQNLHACDRSPRPRLVRHIGRHPQNDAGVPGGREIRHLGWRGGSTSARSECDDDAQR